MVIWVCIGSNKIPADIPLTFLINHQWGKIFRNYEIYYCDKFNYRKNYGRFNLCSSEGHKFCTGLESTLTQLSHYTKFLHSAFVSYPIYRMTERQNMCSINKGQAINSEREDRYFDRMAVWPHVWLLTFAKRWKMTMDDVWQAAWDDGILLTAPPSVTIVAVCVTPWQVEGGRIILISIHECVRISKVGSRVLCYGSRRWLKTIPFNSCGKVSYQCSITLFRKNSHFCVLA